METNSSGRRGPKGAEAELTCDCAGAEGGLKRVRVSSEWVSLERELGGLQIMVNVPTGSFRGVGLRASPEAGTYEIILLHIDPSLEVILARAEDDTDVIARWRALGAMLGLPLLVEDDVGRLMPIQDHGVIVPVARRGGSPLKHRRPRFLARRTVGSAAHQPVHAGEREMFAAS